METGKESYYHPSKSYQLLSDFHIINFELQEVSVIDNAYFYQEFELFSQLFLSVLQWHKAYPENRASQPTKLSFWLFLLLQINNNGHDLWLHPPPWYYDPWMTRLYLWPWGRKVLPCLVSENVLLCFKCPKLSYNYPWMSLCFPALEDYSLVQSCAVWNSFISLLLKPKFILLRNLINTHCSKLYFVYMLSQHLSYYILAISTSDFPTRLWTYFCSLSSIGQLSLMVYAFTLVISIFSGCEMTRFPNTPECSLIKS